MVGPCKGAALGARGRGRLLAVSFCHLLSSWHYLSISHSFQQTFTSCLLVWERGTWRLGHSFHSVMGPGDRPQVASCSWCLRLGLRAAWPRGGPDQAAPVGLRPTTQVAALGSEKDLQWLDQAWWGSLGWK